MATTIPIPDPATSPARVAEGDQCVAMWGIGWGGYRSMLRLRGRRSVPRMTYLDGDLWLMSPSFSHEHRAERLGHLVLVVAEELDIPFIPAGHTTFRRKRKRVGVEGDKTFYFANEVRVRGKAEIDLRFDPPPDLAIEAVHTNPVAPAVAAWRRLHVPEIWTCDADRLRILVRRADGRYGESEASASLPTLAAVEAFAWATRPQTSPENAWLKDVRRWVREVLVPRAQGRGG